MRRRILQSTLIVVTIMGLILGVPLAFTTWVLVEDVNRAELTGTLEQIASRVDEPDELAALDASQLELALPAGGRLVIEQDGEQLLAVGPELDPSRSVVETLPFAPGGTLTIAEPDTTLRTQQLQVTFVVVLLVVLSLAAGTGIAIWTARRLAGPLSDVADRAARLGAGDFRAAPQRYGIPELDRVSDVLDTSASALAALLQRERDLVGDVSHQLRSRITALQLRLDELATHPDESARREALAALEQTEKLTEVLGTERLQPVILVGVGHLGAALVRYRGFQKEGFEILAGFDIDVSRKRAADLGLKVYPMSRLKSFVAEKNVKMAILTVPATVAQEVANDLVEAGIQAILNFAPTILQVPDGVVVNNVDLAIELENLSYFIR